MEFEFDMRAFKDAIQRTPEVVFAATKRGMHDAMDEWKAESVDVAPLDKGTLRRGISTEVRQKNGEVSGEISAVAIENTPKWPNFNYAYYIHEVKGDIKNPTTPGTVAKFIDAPADEHKQKWLKDIEDGVKAEVQKLGF
ncbi:hypothetical protein C0R09_18650 [Brevibacillus laterosporus]|uniref:hypothetical protein n=1 Tax=Brevibacillus laterosporus TaxID=1465 RepID=UPI0002404B5C|nr:hypothetical protein [Brevibacillus laterosporus]AUM66376.1 hypothetical protein C0R09_18650 [Brevibacillus laterosporus]CCF14217.1 hypothetical protein BLGI_2143 [Brevibacillus laterosporus GI-9]